MSKLPARKRFLVAVPLGILAGLICISLIAQTDPTIWDWRNPLFWTVLSDRFLIGLVIAGFGAYTQHPIFGFCCSPWLRGAALGATVSLPLATGALLTTGVAVDQLWFAFWATLVTGAIYGLIIDLVATRLGGQGKDLIVG